MAKKPGKYAAVMNGLPRLKEAVDPEGEDPRYQDKVNAVKETITDRRGVALATSWRDLRRQRDEVKAQLKKLQLQIDATAQLMDDAYEVEGVTSLTLLDGADEIRRQDEPYSSCKDKDLTRLWFVREDLSNMLSVHPSTLAAFTKQRLLDGQPAPDGVEVMIKPKWVWVRGKQAATPLLAELEGL